MTIAECMLGTAIEHTERNPQLHQCLIMPPCSLIQFAFIRDIYRTVDTVVTTGALQQGGPLLCGHLHGDEALRPGAPVRRQPR